jgi:NTP pyrophosphatase (non-canonical NTP hydrolase)
MINETDLEAWEYYNEAYKNKMSMNDYQNMASKTAIYNSTHSILYPALGLAGEAGEVANKVKKMIRDGNFDRQGIAAEIGDVLWYVAALSRDLNIDLHDIALQNLEKLYDRKSRGTLGGSGDKR